MKPFDLEAAKRGEPIVCRDGTPVKFIAHVPEAYEQLRVVFLRGKQVQAVYESGKEFRDCEDRFDLFMAPKKRIVWVNLYPDRVAGNWYDSEADANRGSSSLWNRIGGKAYPVEIEE